MKPPSSSARSISGLRSLLIAAVLVAPPLHAQGVAAAAATQNDPAATIARIQKEVAGIRGLPFKNPVPMEKQTPEGLGRHMDSEMAEAVPGAMDKHFDKIVRRLGLYKGPELGDFRTLMRAVMTSQAAAYYDPDTKRIYILAEGGDELEQGVIYSHELYHALQDQYFDLNSFISAKSKLDSDQSLARVAVIEGEATYIHTLWATKQMINMVPPRPLLEQALRMQADMAVDQLRGAVEASGKATSADIENIPPFILEILIGNYLKGAAFVFAVQEQGWPAVEKLYKEYPPQSTEQILHPEKWVAREGAAKYAWPDLAKEKSLQDWELLDDDVLGEIQWRIIFTVQGFKDDSIAASAGWNGDRYAVFKRKSADETMLLLRTSWDSEAEATQFAGVYRRLLVSKYQGTADPWLVEQQGADVFIVEGGRKAETAALMKVVKQAKKSGK